MSTPGTTPTSAKMPASLNSSLLPNLPRLSRTTSRTAASSTTSASSAATVTLTQNSQTKLRS